MKLDKSKLDKATKVLRKVEKILSSLDEMDGYSYWLESYCNGREQGYCIHGGYTTEKQVCFSENRNSDDIVVYPKGKQHERFSMQGNVPSEESYREAKYFRYDESDGAAEFIVQYLIAE